jgi:hypothetical protein
MCRKSIEFTMCQLLTIKSVFHLFITCQHAIEKVKLIYFIYLFVYYIYNWHEYNINMTIYSYIVYSLLLLRLYSRRPHLSQDELSLRNKQAILAEIFGGGCTVFLTLRIKWYFIDSCCCILLEICIKCDCIVLYPLWKMEDTIKIKFESWQTCLCEKRVVLKLFLLYNFVMENVISGGK